MSVTAQSVVVCCNGAPAPSRGADVHRLDYRPEVTRRNVTVGLPAFVQDVYHIAPRILDLLEIAAYVFSADRLTERGRRDQVEYQSWSRRFRLLIRVRDHQFWSNPEIGRALGDLLRFVTGDAQWEFEFLPGHSTPPTSLFDQAGFSIPASNKRSAVVLFSGGLDSLAGTLEELADTSSRVILVSHQSQTATTRTQRQLVRAFQARFGADRVAHYRFECHLRGHRATEETQRTRSFLYSSIGFAIATAHRQPSFAICENGVTSMNLRRREDLANARASRTTHPQTISRLSRFFSLVSDGAFEIRVPFLWCTKADVVRKIAEAGYGDLIASTVSCSRTFLRMGQATHCGTCFQCVDRRMAIHAAGLERFDDPGLYAVDIIRSDIADPEARTTAVDYVRQARSFSQDNIGYLENEYLADLSAIVEHLPSGGDELDRVESIWRLMKRHGEAVHVALRRMRELHDDPFQPLPHRSLLGLLADREHLKPEVARALESVCRVVEPAIHEMFRGSPPKNEGDLNQKISALVRTHEPKLRSEHPAVSFACARVVPDHELENRDLLIEAKYVRAGTPPSKASEGIAADLTKYPESAHILFLVYDPNGAIAKDDEFRRAFEAKGRCTVMVLR